MVSASVVEICPLGSFTRVVLVLFVRGSIMITWVAAVMVVVEVCDTQTSWVVSRTNVHEVLAGAVAKLVLLASGIVELTIGYLGTTTPSAKRIRNIGTEVRRNGNVNITTDVTKRNGAKEGLPQSTRRMHAECKQTTDGR